MAAWSIIRITLFLCSTFTQETAASLAEKLLRTSLFDSYNKLALPVRNSTDTLLIHFGIFIEQILDVDERNQLFTSKVWVKQVWHDHSLEWDPTQYEGIQSIKVPSDSIWIPDTLIYNNILFANSANGTFEQRAIPWAGINYTGYVTWFPPALYKTACRIDVKFFPFDEQRCTLKFGSWSYDGGKIDLIPSNNSAEEREYWQNGEWSIVQSLCMRNLTKHQCYNETYVDVTCTFVLRRMALYYFAYIFIPCGLISFNTILVFYLPPNINKKISLCSMVLLCMTLFLLLVNQRIPPNATSFPLIVKYLLFTIVTESSSIVLTIYILNLCHRSPRTHKMPKWVRKLFLDILPKFLIMQKQVRYANRSRNVGIILTNEIICNNKIDAGKLFVESSGNNISIRMRNELDKCDGDVYTFDNSETPMPESVECSEEGTNLETSFRPMIGEGKSDALMVHKAIEEIMHIASTHQSQADINMEKEDWRYLAMVVDRIFLILYLCAVCTGTFVIIMEAPLATYFLKHLLFPVDNVEEEYSTPNIVYLNAEAS